MNGENQKVQDDKAAAMQSVPATDAQSQPQQTVNTTEVQNQTQQAEQQTNLQEDQQNPWTVSGLDQSGMGPEGMQYAPAAEIQSPEVNWTASEFIAHDKSPTWYLGLGGTAIVLALFAFFVMHDMIALVSIIFVAVLFGAVASHKPRTLQYSIDASGITIGKKTYAFGEFKSFGVVREEAFSNVTFMPLKRFSPPLSIYYPPEEEEKIVQALAAYLPMAPIRPDFIDGILRRVHL